MTKKYLAANLPDGKIAVRSTANNYTHIAAFLCKYSDDYQTKRNQPLDSFQWSELSFHSSSELAAKALENAVRRCNWLVVEEMLIIPTYEIDSATFKSLKKVGA